MLGIRSKLLFLSVLASSLTLFGCSSDGDGDSGGATTLTITEANSKEAVTDAVEGGSVLLDLGGTLPTSVDIDLGPSPRNIIDIAIDKAMNMPGSTIPSLPTGAVIDPPIDCTGGGTITGDIVIVLDVTSTVSGTISYNQCVEAGITLNGTVTFSQSSDSSTNDFEISMSGSLSGTDGVDTVSLNNLTFNQTGNTVTRDRSINTYTFSVAISGGEGFSAELLAPIVSNDDLTCTSTPTSPSSGIILVTGASNTQARGTVNGDGTVTVEFNPGSGTFTPVTTPGSGSPYPCSDFFI